MLFRPTIVDRRVHERWPSTVIVTRRLLSGALLRVLNKFAVVIELLLHYIMFDDAGAKRACSRRAEEVAHGRVLGQHSSASP
jgi:hypothetical protein